MTSRPSHQLRSLSELARELGIDSGWLLANAESGNLPAKKLTTSDYGERWYFHFSGTCNAIAEMIQTEFLSSKVYPPVESNESEKGAASE